MLSIYSLKMCTFCITLLFREKRKEKKNIIRNDCIYCDGCDLVGSFWESQLEVGVIIGEKEQRASEISQ